MTGIGKNYSYYISSAATETGLSVEQAYQKQQSKNIKG